MTHWKEIWQIVSSAKHTPKDALGNVLNAYGTKLFEGISQFSQFDEDTYKEWARANLVKTNSITIALLYRLCKSLDLDAEDGWNVLCNYLIYEYHGTVEETQRIAQYEMQIIPLLQNIWHFYSFERMFILKSFKYMLQHRNDTNYSNYEELHNLVEQFGMNNIRKSLMKQFKRLIYEINAENHENSFLLKYWIQRNNAEILEIVEMLLLTADTPFSPEEFLTVFLLFKEHSFGTQPAFYEALQYTNKQTIKNIQNSEIVLFLLILNNYWSNDSDWLSVATVLETELIDMSEHGDHSVVLLSWIVLNMSLQKEENASKFMEFYSKYTERAIQQNVFKNLNDLLTADIVKSNTVIVMLHDAVFNLLTQLIVIFDNCTDMFLDKGINEIVISLLKDRSLAVKCMSESNAPNGLKIALNETMIMFPIEYATLTKMMMPLCSHGETLQKTVTGLCSIDTYTEQHGYYMYDTHPDETRHIKTCASYTVPNNPMVHFPENTPAVVFTHKEERFIRFVAPISYFWIVENQLTSLIAEVTQGLEESVIDFCMEQLLESTPLLRTIMDTDYTVVEANEQLSKWEELVYKLLFKFMEVAYYNVEFMVQVLQLCTIRCRFKLDDTRTLLNGLNLIPALNDMPVTYDNLYKVNIIAYGILLQHEFQRKREERSNHRILRIYIDFFITYRSLNKSEDKSHVELPGFIIILKDVFPNLITWKCDDEKVRNHIAKIVLRLFIAILKQVPSDASSAHSKLMFDMTLKYLHDQEAATLTLLQICSTGNVTLQRDMQNETDWENGPICDNVTKTQLGLTLLMQLLTLRNHLANQTDKTRLEREVYNHNSNNFQIIKVIAGYLTLPYNSVIPLLAARLLKKFTAKLELSLIAALNMEQEQIRLMLLQCLRDPSETTDMKVAIVELITTCIEKQHGMTIAFFGINNTLEVSAGDNKTSVSENIVDYMAEYIRNTAKTTAYLYSPLFIAILNLFHVLWQNDKEILLQDLVQAANFWEAFASPLFQDLMLDNNSYAQILNILTKELYKGTNVEDESLQRVVDRFFDPDKETIYVWMNHIKQSVKHKNHEIDALDQLPHWLLLMNAWHEFTLVVITLTYDTLRESYITHEIRSDLAKLVRESLLDHLIQADDNRVIGIWANLYIMYQSYWRTQDFMQEETVIRDFVPILHKLADVYHELPKKCQESLLTMLYVSITCAVPYLRDDPTLTLDLLEPGYTRILNYEYDSFDKTSKPVVDEWGVFKKHPQASLVICLTTINSILELPSSECIKTWFILNQYINKLVNIVITCTPHSHLFSISQIAIEGLNMYARSDMAFNFTRFDLKNEFFPLIRPRKELQNLGKTGFNKRVVLWAVREWCIIYTKVYTFNLTLLNQCSSLVLEEFLSFLTVHEQTIIDTFLMIKYTVDIQVLDLIICMLLFIKRLLPYRIRWYHAYGQVFNSIMESGVQYLINYAIGILLRPKILRDLTEIDNFDTEFYPSIDKISAELMDKLSDIITLSTFCYLEYSPKLIDIIQNAEDISKYPILLDADFRVPKVNMDAECQLSYGSLLCTAHLYIKALQQMVSRKRLSGGGRREILTARKRTESVHNTDAEKQFQITSPTYNINNLPDNSKEYKRVRKTPVTSSQSTGEYPSAVSILFANINAYKLNSIQTFASSSTSGMCAPWLARLTEQKVHRSLEAVMTLVAEQAVLTLNDATVDRKDMQFVRRELFSELQIFHEFVKKRLVDLYRYNATEKTVLLRKKFGTSPYLSAGEHQFLHVFNKGIEERVTDNENDSDDWTTTGSEVTTTLDEGSAFALNQKLTDVTPGGSTSTLDGKLLSIHLSGSNAALDELTAGGYTSTLGMKYFDRTLFEKSSTLSENVIPYVNPSGGGGGGGGGGSNLDGTHLELTDSSTVTIFEKLTDVSPGSSTSTLDGKFLEITEGDGGTAEGDGVTAEGDYATALGKDATTSDSNLTLGYFFNRDLLGSLTTLYDKALLTDDSPSSSTPRPVKPTQFADITFDCTSSLGDTISLRNDEGQVTAVPALYGRRPNKNKGRAVAAAADDKYANVKPSGSNTTLSSGTISSSIDCYLLDEEEIVLYKDLNEIKLVEEDYMHMLSNWFINTCQLHH